MRNYLTILLLVILTFTSCSEKTKNSTNGKAWYQGATIQLSVCDFNDWDLATTESRLAACARFLGYYKAYQDSTQWEKESNLLMEKISSRMIVVRDSTLKNSNSYQKQHYPMNAIAFQIIKQNKNQFPGTSLK
jgi:hypothetical protein